MLGGGEGGREDAEEFFGFVLQGSQSDPGDDASVFQEFEPEKRFVGLLDHRARFADEVGPGFGAAGRAIIGGDGGPGAEKLFSQDARLIGFGQALERAYHS